MSKFKLLLAAYSIAGPLDLENFNHFPLNTDRVDFTLHRVDFQHWQGWKLIFTLGRSDFQHWQEWFATLTGVKTYFHPFNTDRSDFQHWQEWFIFTLGRSDFHPWQEWFSTLTGVIFNTDRVDFINHLTPEVEGSNCYNWELAVLWLVLPFFTWKIWEVEELTLWVLQCWLRNWYDYCCPDVIMSMSLMIDESATLVANAGILYDWKLFTTLSHGEQLFTVNLFTR